MSDTNKNSKVDPDEATSIVGEENIVNEAYLDDKIDEKKLQEIDSLDTLGKEAEQIKMENGMGTSAVVSDIKAEDIKVEIPEEDKAKPEEQPQPSVPTPPEVTQEVTREPTSEVAKEVSGEAPEIGKEFKTGI